ncbi:MAG: type III-A CRISPR-associated protein Csm2 [Candidatus Brocadiales bacterium]
MIKKCKSCGRPLRDPKYDVCYDCSQKNKEKWNKLPDNYLSKGYFDSNDNLHCELLTTTAEELAQSFGNAQLESHQLRRFFNHTKATEAQLDIYKNFDRIRARVQKLVPFAAEAVGKKKAPPVFYDFIKKNVNCIQDTKSFQEGFLEHFQAIVAYFSYHFRKQ